MTALAKTHDGIWLLLRHSPSAQSDARLKRDLDELTADISALVRSKRNIRPKAASMLSQIFSLRLKAINWLSSNSSESLSAMFDSIASKMEELKADERLEVLTENVFFALRCTQRVFDASVIEHLVDDTHVPTVAEITYWQQIESIALTFQNSEAAQKVVDLLNASLHIDFGLIAADIVNDEKERVSDKAINELAFLLADQAQLYSSLATELGILKPRQTKHFISEGSFDDNFLVEQKELANLGLNDFALNFIN